MTLKIQPLLIPIPKDSTETSTTPMGQVLKVTSTSMEGPGYCLAPGGSGAGERYVPTYYVLRTCT